MEPVAKTRSILDCVSRWFDGRKERGEVLPPVKADGVDAERQETSLLDRILRVGAAGLKDGRRGVYPSPASPFAGELRPHAQPALDPVQDPHEKARNKDGLGCLNYVVVVNVAVA